VTVSVDDPREKSRDRKGDSASAMVLTASLSQIEPGSSYVGSVVTFTRHPVRFLPVHQQRWQQRKDNPELFGLTYKS
jgi:hypothetical protein